MNLLLKITLDEKKDTIKNIINKKIGKLTKVLGNNSKISWNYFTENGLYFSEVRVSGFHGPAIRASAHSDGEYEVIDSAIDKVRSQITKRRGKLNKKIRRDLSYIEVE